MAPHRNEVPRHRGGWRGHSLGLGVVTILFFLFSVAAFLRTPDATRSILRTLDGAVQQRRRLSSIQLSPDFHYDGTNSDLAQQFYRRHLAGATADPLRISQGDLPARIQSRLTAVDLRFEALPPLLQRALVWDSGYGQDPDPDTTLVKLYTVGGVPMSEIAIPLDAFRNTGCTTSNCSDPNGRATFRSKNCTGDQILPAARCASESVTYFATHTSMWATGGADDMVPGITVLRHSWNDPVNNTDYVVFGIHTIANEQEPAWDNCPSTGKYASLVVPCDAYRKEIAGQKNWREPQFGAIVTPWLEEIQAAEKRHKVLLCIVLPLSLSAFVLLVVIGLWYYDRRRVAAGKLGCCASLCGQVPGPYKDIWGRSIQHTLLSPSPAAGAGGSGNMSTPSGENGVPSLSPLPSREGEGGEHAEMGRKKIVKRTSSLLTVSSDSTSMAAWDRMTHVLVNDLHLDNKRVALERIHFQRQLSKGGFGDVWLAELDSHPIAVKRLLQTHRVRIQDVEAFVDEIQITASLHHPNIPRFLGVAWTTLDRLCMIVEYLPGGDLQSFLQRPGAATLTWPKEKRVLTLGIAKALQYLHSRAPVMIHRDVKSRNILVKDQPLTAKVTDFGVSRSVQRDYMTLGVGTPYWTAPEVLGGTLYTEKSDIYSFGVVLSEIDTCHSPYHEVQYRGSGSGDSGMHLQPFHLLKRIMAGSMRPSFSDACPGAVRALAVRCLDVDPAVRPTARDVVRELEHMNWA